MSMNAKDSTKSSVYVTVPQEELHRLSHMLGLCLEAYGHECYSASLPEIMGQVKFLLDERERLLDLSRLRLKRQWTPGDGVVLWWVVGVDCGQKPQPMFIGMPSDAWWSNILTHWSRVPTSTWAEPEDDI